MKQTYYVNDNVAIYTMNDLQENSLNEFITKLKNGVYKQTLIECICGQSKNQDQIIISEKDRYGIPVNFFLCQKCGLIFQKTPLSEKSLNEFYRFEYNKLYKGGISDLDTLFEKALGRGKRFNKLVKNLNIYDKIESVFETGCATGANLYPFYLDNKVAHGFDYDENLLNYGRKKGLTLFNIDELDNRSKQTYDLIISSHVLEHVLNPIDFLKSQIQYLKIGKYLLLEVPGIFSFHMKNNKIIDNLVNAHIYYFHKELLINIASHLGLKSIYSDQVCTFLFQKVHETNNSHLNFKFDFNDLPWAQKVRNYLNFLFYKEKFGLIKLNKTLNEIFIFNRHLLKKILLKSRLYKK